MLTEIGVSFAGGYETILGVTPANMESAIRQAFVSCLDARVVLYKRAHGFNVLTPSIAIVVQHQLNCDVAGVAFSVNPLNNSMDECVITSNFGLGESVVAGIVSPDEFVVDKIRSAIISKTLGAKETAVRLDVNGGTFDIKLDEKQTAEFSLSDTNVGPFFN